MSFFKNLFSTARNSSNNAPKTSALEEWFLVRFDSEFISLEISPPNRSAWAAQIEWKRINCACFKAADLYNPDEIYIFTDERPESYLIPTEANGGSALWEEILKRDLFDDDTAIEAATSTNKLFSCPAIEE